MLREVTNTDKFRDKLRTSTLPLLLDGALGTELERRGINVNDSIWSGLAILNNPLEVTQLHLDYLNAGCEIVLTSTYQLSNKALLEKGLPPNEIYSKSIELCVNAKTAYLKGVIDLNNLNSGNVKGADTGITNKRQTYIAGSVGPYGAYLRDFSEYTGDYKNVSDSELKEYHRERLQFLHKNPSIDVLAIETIPRLQEIKVLVGLINELNATTITNKKCYWISCSCKEDGSLADGTPADSLLEFLNEKCDDQLISVGVNCCKLQYSSDILTHLNGKMGNHGNLKDVKLVIYPNSGEAYYDGDGEWSVEFTKNDIHDEFVNTAKDWIKLDKVGVIGGCCRTRPYDIELLRKLLSRSMTETCSFD